MVEAKDQSAQAGFLYLLSTLLSAPFLFPYVGRKMLINQQLRRFV